MGRIVAAGQKIIDELRWRIKRSLYRLLGILPAIREATDSSECTPVDAYWAHHTVNSRPFRSARESERYLEWRFSVYPLSREFMELYGQHSGETVLDYGCGPGNDLVGFALYTRAGRIIGMDASMKALRLAQHRLALHRVHPGRAQLYHTSDSGCRIPLPDSSVDYIHCTGVIQHASHPDVLLRELHRVLRPGCFASVMVYNHDSLWFHLYTAYERKVIRGDFPRLTTREAFSRNTDGEECPIARCYRAQDFISLCRAAGYGDVEYKGGYLSDTELSSLHKYGRMALEDERLGDEHRAFLSRLKYDVRGYPMYDGKHAGIGGVYKLRKAEVQVSDKDVEAARASRMGDVRQAVPAEQGGGG